MAPKCAAAAAAPSSSTEQDGETSSGDSTSSPEQEVADKGMEEPESESESESEEDSTPMAAVKEEFEEEEEGEAEKEWDEDEEEEADGEDEEDPDPDLLTSSKRVDHPVTTALKEVVREDVDLQPSKRIGQRAPVLPEEPAPENPSQPTNSPARDRKRASGEIGKSPAPVLQKSKNTAQHSELTAEPRSKRIRRPWAPDDEVLILEALAQHRRQHGELPTWWDSDFFESIREHLEDNSFHAFAIRDKARSLHRRYESRVVSTTEHDVRIHDLCRDVWGDLPPIDGYEEEADGMPARHPWGAEDGDDGQAENGGTTRSDTTTKGFKEMCEKYPLLAQEVKLLAKAQPSFESSFARLDAKRARDIEKKLETVKYAELKFETRMVLEIHAPKAKISKKLISLLAKVPSKNVV